jgi:acyl carrier protein
MQPASTTLDELKNVLIAALGLKNDVQSFGPSTPLLGSLPELDSMGVIQLVHALEEHFQITIDDQEITEEVFETLGSVANLVEAKRQ